MRFRLAAVVLVAVSAGQLFAKGLSSQTERRIEVITKDVGEGKLSVATRDGSTHQISVSNIVAHRQWNGKTELKLKNGVVLVVLNELSDQTDSEWRYVRRTSRPKSFVAAFRIGDL